MRDAYERFFEFTWLSKDSFIEFGLNETIYIDQDIVATEWSLLKERITNNKKVYIRGFGREAKGTHMFQSLYKELFGNENVTKDTTNNAEPRKLIQKLTGYSITNRKSEKFIANYQVSHVFGRTKNIFTFTAPWNIVFTPRILDPFTGHESTGALSEQYRSLFQKQAFERFREQIEEYNYIIQQLHIKEHLEYYIYQIKENNQLGDKEKKQFEKAVWTELSPVTIKT
jgi:hypothetical protein